MDATTIAVIAAAVGGVAGLAKNCLSSDKTSRRPRKLMNFEKMLDDQQSVDTVTGADVLSRFNSMNVDGQWVIAKPTRRIAEKFGIDNLPPQIEPEKNFFLLVVDNRANISAALMISFAEVDERLKKLLPFGAEDFVVIDRGGA